MQIDEPCLVLDQDADDHAAYRRAYAALAAAQGPKLMLATYFGALGDNLALAMELPVDGLHVDLVRAAPQIDAVLDALPAGRTLSIGVVDGRNIWRADLDAALDLVCRVAARIGAQRLQLAPSCSLLHVPVDTRLETELPANMVAWLAFARQKIDELRVLADAANGAFYTASTLELARERRESRRTSPKVHRPQVACRLAALDEVQVARRSPYAERRRVQHERMRLPAFPTTTIGSFPQTREVR